MENNSRGTMENNSIWELRKCNYTLAIELEKRLKISNITAELLVQRGVDTYEKAVKYLCGELKDLSDPYNLSGMTAAVARIITAMDGKEKIIIYGDYDVDGICSTVLLKKCLKFLGHNADYYIPDRFADGYGLNLSRVEKLAEQGYGLLITVDCGISAVAEVKKATALGMDIIITDHHNPGQNLPPAIAIINPKLDKDGDNRDLAGVGVVFKLAMALCRYKGCEGQVFKWLDLVALATVADIVPLLGDNRILVKYGLKQLADTELVGLKALLINSELNDQEIMPWHISFILAPRLNAAGRLQTAELGIQLLLTEDIAKAQEYAEKLSAFNNERRLIEEKIYNEGIAQLKGIATPVKERILILAGDDWHQGVIGIVASRLTEKYSCPVILISWQGEIGKGSGRSIAGFDLYAALQAVNQYLVKFGGHKMAVGLEIAKTEFPVFKEKLSKYAQKNITPLQLLKKRTIDSEIEIEQITPDLLAELKLLEPFGEGNFLPNFALRRVEFAAATLVGKENEHFKAVVKPKGFEAIAFNRADLKNLPLEVCYCDILCGLQENEYRGKKNIQLKIRELKCTYRPDTLNESSGATNSNLNKLIGKSVNEITNNRVVLYIYPTYRSLTKHRLVLSHYLKASTVQELHGRVPLASRAEIKKQFRAGLSRIYLTTTVFAQNFLRSEEVPANLCYIINFWQQNPHLKWLENQNNLEIETYHGGKRNILWTKAEPGDFGETAGSIIYTNRPKTIRKMTKLIPNVIIEAGVKETGTRKHLRSEFIKSPTSTLLWDGEYTPVFKNHIMERANQILFADVPYSTFETNLMFDNISADENISAVALFNQADIDFNRRYLQRLYPDTKGIKSILAYFLNLKKNPIIMEIEKLCQAIGHFAGRGYKTNDLLPVLSILVDLGLFRIRKKGSIIEITFINTGKTVLDVSKSPYYVEGLAEKKAFFSLEEEYNKSLMW